MSRGLGDVYKRQVREVALRLEADKRITWYRAEVESMESIHNHNAFAVVEKGENECY